MKPNLNEWKAEFRAEKSTKTGRELKTLIQTLNRRLRIYRKKGGPKPEISWKIFDLVTDFDKEVVALCRSRRDYLCTAEVEERCSNPAWVAKATRAVYLHWRKKNKTLNSGQVG